MGNLDFSAESPFQKGTLRNKNLQLCYFLLTIRNYYVHKTRREEAFDSSAVLTPAYDLKQYKLVKILIFIEIIFILIIFLCIFFNFKE